MAKPITFRFLGDAKDLKRAIGESESAMGRMAKAAPKVAGAVTAAVGVASFNAFKNFDEAMVKSQAIMGDLTQNEMAAMEKAARAVGTSTTFSASQAAESFFFLASAGLDAEQSIGALPRVAAFAQAGAFDMALATDLLTDAQSALGLSVDDTAQNMENMQRVSDVLVKGNILANASVEQFSTALTNKAGPALRQVGKDVEEGVAVLAAFADQGIKGEQAGTLLGIVLRDLQTKAISNDDAFAKFGIRVFDSSGEMRNMADITADLENALAGMSDEQKKSTLNMLGFSDKSQGALSALVGTSGAIAEYEEQLRAAGGTTEDVADRQLSSISAQLDLAKSKVADLGISLGGFIAPHVVTFIDELTGGITAFVSAWKNVGRDVTSSGFAGFMEKLSNVIRFDLLPQLKDIVTFFRENSELIMGVGVAIVAMLVPAFVSWAVSAGAAAIATAAAAAPMIALGVVIAGTAALIIRLYRENDTFREKVDAVGRFLRDVVLPIFQKVGGWIVNSLIPALRDAGKWLGEKLIAAGQKAWNWLTHTLIPVIVKVGRKFGGWVGAAIGAVTKVLEWFGKIPAAWNRFTGDFDRGKDRLKEILKAPFVAAFRWIEDKIDSVKNFFNNFSFSDLNPFGRAFGGPVAKSGVFDVGENGRERVFLPKGAFVQDAAAVSTTSDSGQSIVVNMNSNADPFEVGRAIAWELNV